MQKRILYLVAVNTHKIWHGTGRGHLLFSDLNKRNIILKFIKHHSKNIL